MTQLLSWEKPARAEERAKHNAAHSSDSGVHGTYAPNMSAEDRVKWKARRVRGADPRIVIRKGIAGSGSLIVMVVRAGSVTLSMNNKVVFDADGWQELCRAREEALAMLELP